MVRAIMHGCNGAMGRAITDLAEKEEGISIVAGVDPRDTKEQGYPVFPTLDACGVKADVIIDFSNAKAVDSLLDYCEKTGMAVVLCTTGLSEAQAARIEKTASVSPVLRSANMSLGVNVLLKLVKEAAKTLAPAGFDIEILEKHHNQKVDAPSGTALAFADSINEAMDSRYHYRLDRSAVREKREKDEIGIQSIRGGTISGEHDVIFAGNDEVITFSHTAFSKAIFAKGAIQAARFLSDKKAGLYTMADVID